MGTVVKLEKPAAKPRKKRAEPSLIEHCVIYAQSLSAASAGFNVDPDGDSRVAAKFCRAHDARASAALAKIANTRATTPEELKAKASLVGPMLQQAASGPNGLELSFIFTFADDVARLLRPIVEERWRGGKVGRSTGRAS